MKGSSQRRQASPDLKREVFKLTNLRGSLTYVRGREFDLPEREGWCKERREVVLSWTPASCKLLGYPGYGWIRSIGSPSVDLIM